MYPEPQWAAITAIADQKNDFDLGFINDGLYRIGQARPFAARSYHSPLDGISEIVQSFLKSNKHGEGHMRAH